MSHPTVKDLVKMGGGKDRTPKRDVILPFDEMILLHQIIMAAPPKGDGLPLLSTDPRLALLRGHGFVKQGGSGGRWFPTEDGVKHVMPTRRPNRAARRAADALLDKVNCAVRKALN